MLKPEQLNKGLIYTDIEGCIGCSKCIHKCPILCANVCEADSDGSYKVYVDESECTLCGRCTDSCIHDARKYIDDTEEFLADLERGKPISMIVAPAFYLSYPNDYNKIFGYLKSLGVKDFYPAAYGADISLLFYIKYISSTGKAGFISQPCPVVVRHIEIHKPELLPHLAPIQSPLMCTAIYLKEYKNITDDFAFLSPCIAKKIEIQSKRGRGLVKYNVTIKKLLEKLKDTDYSKYPEARSTIAGGMGTLFANPGGMRANLEYYLGPDSSVISLSGEKNTTAFLDSFVKQAGKKDDALPVLADILNCEMGCSYGTAIGTRNTDDYTAIYQGVIMRRQKYGFVKDKNNLETYLSPAARFKALNEMFAELSLEDFMCEYEASANPSKRTVTEEEVQDILENKLKKITDNDRDVDCSACGYSTCRDMAEAIALQINHPDRCVYYVRTTLQENRLLEQRLRAVLDAAPIVSAVISKESRISQVNRAAMKMFEISEQARGNVGITSHLMPEYQPCGTLSAEKVRKVIAYAFETGTAHFEFTFQTADGKTPIPCEVDLRRTILNENEVLMVYMRDMREQYEILNRLSDALEREHAANVAKTKFLSSMSHEIRTPMNAVVGITEQQLRRGNHSTDTEEAFMRILSSSNLLLSIINDILDLSKVEAGKMEIIVHTYETANMIVDSVQLNLMYVGSKKIDFVLLVDEKLPTSLVGDELRIKQILNNLLSNAFKYTGDGEIKLSFAAEDSGDDSGIIMKIVVTDTGQGMTEEQIDNLFETEFNRFNVVRNRDIEGSGLGMVITDRLLKMMGGSIEVTSVPGKGSTFTVRIPQKKHGSEVLGARAAASLQNLESAQSVLKGVTKTDCEPMPYGKVLVVDDVDSNLYVAKGFLAPYGLTVETATSGQEAIDKVTDGNVYDVIFMDHMMPQMDGIEATKKIRATGYKGPIVALTANVFTDSVQMFMDNGFSGFVSKPIELSALDGQLMRFIHEKQPPEVVKKARDEAALASGRFRPIGIPDELKKSFISDVRKAVSVMESVTKTTSYGHGDIETFAIQVHGLKSALHLVEEPELSREAEKLETAAGKGKWDYILSKSRQFIEDVKVVAAGFEAYFEQANLQLQDAAEEDGEFLRVQFGRIYESCENLDIETAKAAAQAARGAARTKKTNELLDAIEEHLLTGDFDEASALCTRKLNEV